MDSSVPFRLAIIGGGRMGRTHLAALRGSEQVAVTGVVEPNPEASAAVRAAGATVFPGLDELLAAGGADGALIAVPTDLHVTVLGQVLAAGLPVLCEKPCGLTVEQTRECASLAEQAGLPLRVAYWRRFVPEVIALRQQIAVGGLGDVLAVNCYQWDLAAPPAGFRASSGGIFADMGVHEFDQTRFLTGQEFVRVQVASARAGAVGGDPDCAQLVAELTDGSTAMVSLGRWHPAGDICKVEAYGTRGTAAATFIDPASDGEAAQHRALAAQAKDFAAVVRAGGSGGSCATVADAIAAQHVVRLAGQASLS